MGEIKYWDYFKLNGCSPYSGWMMYNAERTKFIPILNPCAIHATGFDCFISDDCGCDEWKFAKRSPEDVAEIHKLQEKVRRESILQQAAEIMESNDAA